MREVVRRINSGGGRSYNSGSMGGSYIDGKKVHSEGEIKGTTTKKEAPNKKDPKQEANSNTITSTTYY